MQSTCPPIPLIAQKPQPMIKRQKNRHSQLPNKQQVRERLYPSLPESFSLPFPFSFLRTSPSQIPPNASSSRACLPTSVQVGRQQKKSLDCFQTRVPLRVIVRVKFQARVLRPLISPSPTNARCCKKRHSDSQLRVEKASQGQVNGVVVVFGG